MRKTTGTRIAGLILLLAGVLGAHGSEPPAAVDDARAATGRFVYRSYGADLGLSNIAVVRLLQDSDGFIWAGTDDGLYRYDGYRFDAFGLDSGLLSTSIDALFQDASGVIWVGTRSGLSRRDGQRFMPVGATRGMPEVAISGIAESAAGVWATTPLGPFIADRDGLFHAAPEWPGGEATAVLAARQAPAVWVGVWADKASVAAWRDGRWAAYSLPGATSGERVDGFVEDAQGRVWVRTASALWKLSPGGAEFVREPTPLPLRASHGFISVGQHGDLYVSSDEALLRHRGDQWEIVAAAASLPGGPSPVLEDREGSVWIGSVGLHRLLGRGVFHAFTTSEGLPSDVVWSIFRDASGRLWVGTAGGLAFWQDGKFHMVDGTEHHVVRSIVQAADSTLYMAGIPGNEILAYEPATHRLRREVLSQNSPAKRTFRLLLARDGVLWASTDGAGLFRADTRTAPLQFEPEPLPGGTSSEYISDVREDAAGRIWVAGRNGLAIRDAGQWRRFTAKDGLRKDFLAYARPLARGDALVAYFDPLGVARVRVTDSSLQVIEHFDATSSHSADKVFLVGDDRLNRIWIGGGKGIDLLTPEGSTHFGAMDGLIGVDTASMSFLADDGGSVWFGTTKGLIRFDQAAYAALPPLPAPPTLLLDIKLDGQTQPADARDLRVKHDNTLEVRYAAISFVGEGTIQYRARLQGRETDFHVTSSPEARYSGLSYGDYRFIAAARIGERGPWGPDTVFQFSVLPAWWQTWWVRSLVLLALGALALLALRWRVSMLTARNRRLEMQIAERTREVQQANRKLGDSNNQLQRINEDLSVLNRKLVGAQTQLVQAEKMASIGQLAAGVAHEINNPIGYVRSNLAVLGGYVQNLFSLLHAYESLEGCLSPQQDERRVVEQIKASIELDYMRADAVSLMAEAQEGVGRVQKIVQDLRDFSHIDQTDWQLTQLHDGLESTLNILGGQLRPKAEIVRDYGDLPLVECVPAQINQVFLNLLINAAQSIQGYGRITITTGVASPQVWVSIADTGVGIEPAVLSRVFEPFFTTRDVGSGTGLGLSVSYGIVHSHGGTIEVTSAPGCGSTFVLRLPIRARIDTAQPEDGGDAVRKP